MRSEDSSAGQSFIEQARRAQIVQCAIDTIAAQGYGQASLARIAERAGISKGVISYHFAGKDDLIRAVVEEIFTAAQDEVRPHVAAESTAAGKIRAYIQGRIEFLRTHPRYMFALAEIWVGFRTDDDRLRLGSTEQEPELATLERIFRKGQRDREFGRFSTRVMAVSLRQAIDGALLELAAHPDVDLDAYARELIGLFERATRTGP